MELPARLPEPSADERAASERMRDHLRQALRVAGGFLPFEQYMELALFAPGLGYYVGGTQKFGRDGDFTTAPERSPLFGRAIANFWQLQGDLGDTVLEFGGGSGRLAVAMLGELARRNALPARYVIVELSPELRERQQALLQAQSWAGKISLEWLSGPPAVPYQGLVLANEVLDSLPVVAFEIGAEGLLERGVVEDGAGFRWASRPAGALLARRLEATLAGSVLPEGFRGEVNLRLPAWLADLRNFVRGGLALLFDYGEPRQALHHPSQVGGTLRSFYRHRLLDDPFWRPGLQDITASVDFTHVAEAAGAAGLRVLGYTTQASFLLANGIERMLGDAMADDAAEGARLALEARALLLPGEMGVRFKVMALGLGRDAAVDGFGVRDERHRL